MKKEIKRFKIKGSENWTPVDMSQVYKNMEESRKREQEQKRIEEEKEELRINKIKCPICKSTDKINHIRRDSNGIMGSGFNSWVIEQYLICKSCGVHYSDITKLKF
jgi:C4-type Zn-finger protein